MQFADFPLLEPEVHFVRAAADPPAMPLRRNVEVSVSRDADGVLWLGYQDELIELDPDSCSKSFVSLADRRDLVWLLLKQLDDTLQLQTILPSGWTLLDEPVQIAVDEQNIATLAQRNAIDLYDSDKALAWLKKEFIVDGRKPWVAVLREAGSRTGDWTLIGQSWRAHLQGEAGGRVVVRRLLPQRAKGLEWTRMDGTFEFVEATAASQLLTPAARASFDQSVQNNGSYLALWRKYSEQEWQRSQRQAASLGVLEYRGVEEASDEGGVWRFHVAAEELRRFMDAWRALEADASLELEASTHHPDWRVELDKVAQSRRFRGTPEMRKDGQLLIRSWRKPPPQGYLSLSLAGDRSVQERRGKARAEIDGGRRMPQLRYLLQNVSVPPMRKELHTALSPAARACFKNGKPTPRQEEAIKVALETPDVALIIGPPGTGKTQVIAALERRIAELGEHENVQHQVLISSFQHDAVENALHRTEVFGLPGIKVGGRKSAEGNDRIEHWCKSTRAAVEANLAAYESGEPYLAKLQRLRESIATLRLSALDPERRRTELDQLMDCLQALATSRSGVRISSNLMEDWRAYVAQTPVAGRRNRQETALLSRKVRGLRVTPAAFADDGRERLLDLIATCEWLGGMPEPLLAKLHTLSAHRQADAMPWSALHEAKDALLDALTDYRPRGVKNRLDARGLSLLNAIEAGIEDRLKASRLGKAGVLMRYRDALALDPVRAADTVREYAMIVGATCQQAASMSMANLKSLSGIAGTGITFNSVIVDEAARANPLDLFIPMSMAQRRIVLVGDHRQLPHLLEPEVEEEVARVHDLSDEQREAYKTSLFKRLRDQLEAREQQDNVQRVVMLDVQFRMHEVLGDFVSGEFYEKEGLDPVKSGRPASAFRSNVPGHEHRVCGWIDVPAGDGPSRETRAGLPSWRRTSEAIRTAHEAVRLLDLCGDEVSVGVITFYSAQRDEIFRQLMCSGHARRDDETREWVIDEKYRTTRDGEERFRVGTVDAFQGKEFDIVLLSVVRSNRQVLDAGGAGGEAFERGANKKYGHLRLSNRMNVAMSRQRSLLIAIGDRAMAECDGAGEAVPALSAFLQLCKGEHGHVL
ncbi:DNA helicase [Caballeronia calidae]|uniref:DNA helicase n=1 Tax=Caballeronia calidae TaxID=1777139 RepID=A0A158DZ00_9BURK|nr:AAA domain-containing protein [Caballeronia calidae]SAK99753.1 DNA helicase [Caballeronia calidae]